MGEISFEYLFDLLRKERDNGELIYLPQNFYLQVVEYLKSKQELLSQQKTSSYLTDGDAIKKQLLSIRKVLKELYDRREHKIFELAANKAKTGSEIVDLGHLTEEEKQLFNEVYKTLLSFRGQLVFDVFAGKTPKVSKIAQDEKQKEYNFEQKVEEIKENFNEDKEVKVKILRNIPKFLSKDSDVFGPFNQDQEVALPNSVAQALIKKGHAQDI